MLELTPDNVLDYLVSNGRLASGTVTVEPLGWGVSNAVFRIVTEEHCFVLKQSRPQLRTRDAWFSDIERIYREQEVMQLLQPLLPPLCVPEILFVDRENYLFAMAHAPQEACVWKELLLAGEVDLGVGELAGTVLGTIHEKSGSDPESLAGFADRRVFEQLRIDPFYVRIQQRIPDLADEVQPLIERMRSARTALCHGDFSPKNILVHSRGFTLVDYETGHLGDPTMDLGFFLSHLILKALHNTSARIHYFDLTRAFWRGYRGIVRSLPLSELESWGIRHFAVCILARIDGTSPVDYLPDESLRSAARRLGRSVLLERPTSWEAVLRMCEREMT